MTLADLANFICGKVNQSEVEDLAACKGFLQARFKMLWADQLWKDSLVSYTQLVDPTVAYTPGSTWLPTKGVLLVPPIVERVIAVRNDTRKLNVQRSEFYYRVDFDAFSKQGTPTDFVILPGCVWELDSAYEILIAGSAAADAALVASIDLLGTDGVGVTRSSVAIGNAPLSVGTSDRVDALLKPVSAGKLSLEASAGITVVNNRGDQGQAAIIMGPDVGMVNPDQSYLLAFGQSVKVQPDFWIGQQLAIPSAIPGGTTFRGTITVVDANTYTFAATPPTVVATLQPADTAAAIRQRIRLVQIPQSGVTQPFTLRVLGKRTAPTFTNDLDQPGLTGVENCLIAFAQADMLQRERHYAKASALQQEGQLLLAQLKEQEVVQMAHEQRIIPEHGYGTEEWNRLYGFEW